ncbi:ABC transporter permease subunit [Aeromonas sp. QDB05]|uniref:ABC transporter permease subunit n=1 Tax=Aeromonas sp. QDB05 TaxID=2990478 RepID=UPI0022E22912|nr:ABC transporter permease subunit [Aeromonas sp. QDB05]
MCSRPGLSVALARLYGLAPLVILVRFYVWLIRGTPLLVQLFLIFYGLPSAGIVLDAFTAAVIGFTLNIGALQLGDHSCHPGGQRQPTPSA